MSYQKEQNVSDEDIPSDFFDDFNKDEFIDGLSVIDSWDDDIKNKRKVSRINAEAINSVEDVRELISDRKDDASRPLVIKDSENPWESSREPSEHKTEEYKSSSHLDDYIKPGSRRDPNKTNKAIKKDKEVKVKQYLAKHLDSSEDLKPPGTELDDFFDESKLCDKREKSEHRAPDAYKVKRRQNWNHERSPRGSPVKHHWSEYKHENYRRTSHWSPHQNTQQHSPYRRSRREEFHYTQQYNQRSPYHRSPHHRSPYRHSPHRRTSHHRSPHRRSPLHRSPHRRSSRHSPLRHRSRSPKRSSYSSRKSRSRSPQVRDSFLYPQESQLNYTAPQFFETTGPQYTGPMPNSQGYAYGQNVAYTGGYSDVYQYEAQPMPLGLNMTPASYAPPMPVPQPVPAPGLEQPVVIPTPIPAMVPAPQQIPPVPTVSTSKTHETVSATTPYDALAQLVADGKLSQEDYLKLAPNKGSNSPMDTKTRVAVLNRCNTALSKLGNLVLPNRLIINNHIIGQEQKKILPKYCSPLKRYGNVDFHFSKPSGSPVQHNKQILDGIIAAIGLENVVAKPSRKPQKNMKDAAVQTTRPYCDICEIREATKLYDAGTSIDREYFQSTVHTQVVEQDLFSSKAVFNPTGSIGDSAPISIAHMTPAQLVSQLAARAKTLKQNPDSSDGVYGRRNAQNNYDYNQKGGGGHQYHNNYNYRY